MIIILEGPDGAGKSTLAKKLVGSCNAMYKAFDKPKTREEKRGMYDMYKEFIVGIPTGTNVVMDRSWHSEQVYGPVMRDERNITYTHMKRLEELVVALHGGIIIHCTDSLDLLWDRCQARGEDYITSKETLKKIVEGYNVLLHYARHDLTVTKYEISKNMPTM